MTKYYQIGLESVEDIVEHLESESWSGARDRIQSATDEQKKQVAERLQDYYSGGEYVDETTINDIVWFDCDDIFDDEEESEDETQE